MTIENVLTVCGSVLVIGVAMTIIQRLCLFIMCRLLGLKPDIIDSDLVKQIVAECTLDAIKYRQQMGFGKDDIPQFTEMCNRAFTQAIEIYAERVTLRR